jgi:hypothetical protein
MPRKPVFRFSKAGLSYILVTGRIEMIRKSNSMKIAIFVIAGLFAGCSMNVGTNQAAAAPSQNVATAGNTAKADTPSAGPANMTPVSKSAADKCGPVKIPGLRFIAKQSFAFDYKPFEGSCFVTFGSEEDMLDDKDVPRGSTFHIFKDGKQVFEFPDAFAGQPACWVEAVAFDDLNGDGQTDVVMAGKCLAAKDSYPANAVYVNNGRGFTTKEAPNEKLGVFKTIKDIEAFVKQNQKMFFQ